MEKKLFFVSGNETKVKEAQHILGFPIHIASIDLPEIQESDIEKIVTQKVIDAYEEVKNPVLVDDVGVYISAWNGFPGPLLKFLIKAGGNSLILKMLGDEKNRKAEFVSAIGFYDGDKLKTFIGKVTGTLTTEVMDKSNNMVDAIFIPDGADKTYSEMTIEEKSRISHRRKSLEMLREFINENGFKYE